jgi:hypothetical protein
MQHQPIQRLISASGYRDDCTEKRNNKKGIPHPGRGNFGCNLEVGGGESRFRASCRGNGQRRLRAARLSRNVPQDVSPDEQAPERSHSAQDNTWEDWVKRTGELPRDFEAMPSIPGLPDPLLFTENGRQMPVARGHWYRYKRLAVSCHINRSAASRITKRPQA